MMHGNEVLIIGIDPGRKGAVCLRQSDGTLTFWDAPKDFSLHGIWQWLGVLFMRHATTPCYIEQPIIMPRSIKATATMWKNYGIYLGNLVCYVDNIIEVLPQQWQRDMGIVYNRKAVSTKTQSLRIAKRLFSQADFQDRDGRADAALIAEWGYRDWRKKNLH